MSKHLKLSTSAAASSYAFQCLDFANNLIEYESEWVSEWGEDSIPIQ